MHPVGRLCKLPRMTVLTSASYVKVMPRPGRPKNPQTFPPLPSKTPSPRNDLDFISIYLTWTSVFPFNAQQLINGIFIYTNVVSLRSTYRSCIIFFFFCKTRESLNSLLTLNYTCTKKLFLNNFLTSENLKRSKIITLRLDSLSFNY